MSDDVDLQFPGPKLCAIAWLRNRATGTGTIYHDPKYDSHLLMVIEGSATVLKVNVCRQCGCLYAP